LAFVEPTGRKLFVSAGGKKSEVSKPSCQPTPRVTHPGVRRQRASLPTPVRKPTATPPETKPSLRSRWICQPCVTRPNRRSLNPAALIPRSKVPLLQGREGEATAAETRTSSSRRRAKAGHLQVLKTSSKLNYSTIPSVGLDDLKGLSQPKRFGGCMV